VNWRSVNRWCHNKLRTKNHSGIKLRKSKETHGICDLGEQKRNCPPAKGPGEERVRRDTRKKQLGVWQKENTGGAP